MDQSTTELKHDIERTRRDMGVTIDAIEDRIRPGRVIQRRKNRLANTMHSVRARVMGAAHDAEHAVSQSASDAADSMRHAPETVTQATQGSPLMTPADQVPVAAQ